MDNVTFQDVLNQVDDICQNYNVTNISLGNKTRAANRGIEYVQRKLGLPSTQVLYSLYYYQDQLYYDCPDYFNELLQIFYNTTEAGGVSDSNFLRNRWFNATDIEILRNTGVNVGQNRAAFTSINGKNQLILRGQNVNAPILINPFNSTTGVTFSTSGTNISIDSNIYQSGGSSLKFDVDASESVTTVTITGNWDIRQLLNSNASYRLFLNFPTGVTTTTFSSVSMQVRSSVSDYYSMSTSTQYDGSAWTTNAWSKLGFNLNTASTTGTPDASSITSIVIRLVHAGTFSPVTNMRINSLSVVTPDLLDCIYYTAIKGTDSTGLVSKALLDEGSDICNFGKYAPDLIMPVAYQAALLLFPQLRGDVNFWQMYRQDAKESLDMFGKIYPRKKAVYAQSSELIR